MQRVLQDGYREQITTIGQEQAYIFQNGQVIEATWKKPARDKQIRFYDNKNQEIAINKCFRSSQLELNYSLQKALNYIKIITVRSGPIV